MSQHWTDKEVREIVRDYFSMLSHELREESFNKSAHRRDLKKRLNNRSDGSIERKHQNISAVMLELGLPYINGYKPLPNYQRAILPDAVLDHVMNHPGMIQMIEKDVLQTPEIPTVENILESLVEPPVVQLIPKLDQSSDIQNKFFPHKFDYLKQEANNQKLGSAGETFVINFERARLIHAGKESLAEKVEQVSVTVGDNAGFDILSFETNGKDRFIEAKTTKYGKETPFYVTRNELLFSQSRSDNYHLYRVFDFRKQPRLFLTQGDLECRFTLHPQTYVALM